MRKRRVKFIWGASRVIRGRWRAGLFGWYERVPGDAYSGLAISIRGVLGWGALLAAVVYIAGASALYSVWRRNPYNELTYADAVLYPLRRAELAEKKGRAFLREGSALFRAGKYADAANLLRLGLARCPGDLTARLELAQFYLLANQRPSAMQVLEAGLPATYPGRPYLEALFNAKEQAEDYDGVVAVAGRYLPQLSADATRPERQWLVERTFAALMAAGKPGDALSFADANATGNAAAEHRVAALLALRRPMDALAALDAWQQSPAIEPAVRLRLRARALREAGRLDDMESALRQLQAVQPAEPEPAAYGVAQRALAGDVDRAAAALEDYLFRFGGSVENLVLVAEPLARINHLPLLQRCATAASERGYPLQRFHALLAQVHLHDGDWKQARERIELFLRAIGRDAGPNRAWGEWMQRLVAAAETPNDAVQLAFLEFVRARSWPMPMFRASVESLLRADRRATARETIGVGLHAFPQNAWLKSTGEQLKPGVDAAAAARPESLPAEQAFFERLELLVDAGDWDGAEGLVRQARAARPAPAWLDRRDAELWLAQLHARQARRDVAGLATAARMYLGGKEQHANRLLEVARGFREREDTAGAVVVTREVLRRFPALAAAQQQLAEFEPPEKK